MIDDNMTLEPKFDAALSNESMEDGESRHARFESLRRVAMIAGLTNSSEELIDICNSNPKDFQDALEFGLESHEHYQDLLQLIESAILRIYTVAANNPAWVGSKDIERLEERVTNIISTRSQSTKH